MMIADYPFLGFPIIKQLWEGILALIGGYFSRALQTGATFIVIDHQVNTEESNLTKALAALIAAQKSGDPVAIQKAIKDYANAHSALIHSDGSAHPQ